MSDTDSDESQGTGENYDQEQESSLNILGKRLHDENSDLIRNAAAKKAKLISDWSFLKSTGNCDVQTQIKKKRSYGAKHVCLSCANNESLKNKSKSIICRGTFDQLKRHYERNHCTPGSKCMYTNESQFKNIVPMDHISVPHNIRALTTKEKLNELVNNEPGSEPVASQTKAVSSNSAPQATETDITACEKLQDPTLPSEIFSDSDNPSVDESNFSANKKLSTSLQSGIERYTSMSKPDFEAKMVEMVENSRKVDKLMISSGPSALAEPSSSRLTPSDSFSEQMKESYSKMKEWKNVKNLLELVANIDCLTLYPLPPDDMHIFKDGGAILRCETCFTLYRDKANKLTAARAARKLSSDCVSICTGKYLNPECMTEMMSGKGDNWRRLKSRVLQHMICATDGQTHFKALTLLNEEATLKKNHYEAAETT